MDDFATLPVSGGRRSSLSSAGGPISRRRNSLPSTGDRFIASRRLSDFDAAHFKLQSPTYTSSPDLSPSVSSPGEGACGWSKAAYGRRLSCLSEGRNEGSLLAFSFKTPNSNVAGRRGSGDVTSQLKAMYEDVKFANCKPKRQLPNSPEQVLDMPNIKDDFFANTLDWSKRNLIAVAIEDAVYTWDAETYKSAVIPKVQDQKDITALAWHPEGHQLAIGDENGTLLIWDTEKEVLEWFEGQGPCSHRDAVRSISWDPDGNALYIGRACGCLGKIDLRCQECPTKMFSGHRFHSVFATSISPDGRHLACSGDDKTVVWSTRNCGQPLQKLISDRVATKALDWCPWQPNILATGVGTQAGEVTSWNMHTGQKMAESHVDCEISSLLWASETRELVTGHGSGHDDVIFWKPNIQDLEPVGSLRGHNGRVLNMTLNPEGDILASCGADENLMLWDCFSKTRSSTLSSKKTKTKLKDREKTKRSQDDHLCLTSSLLAMSIR